MKKASKKVLTTNHTKKFSYYYGPTSSFLCKIFYGRWTGTGMDTIDRMDKNGLLNGQWTMDRNGLGAD
jgi:hypothetical protein